MGDLRFVRFSMEHLSLYQSWFEDEQTLYWLSPPDLNWFKFVTSDPQTLSWMIYDGYEPVGQVQVGVYENDPRQMSISCAVAPDRRKQGYGTQLLKDLTLQTELAGIKHFHAFVEPNNHASMRLVEKAGFQPVSLQPDEEGFLHYILSVDE